MDRDVDQIGIDDGRRSRVGDGPGVVRALHQGCLERVPEMNLAFGIFSVSEGTRSYGRAGGARGFLEPGAGRLARPWRMAPQQLDAMLRPPACRSHGARVADGNSSGVGGGPAGRAAGTISDSPAPEAPIGRIGGGNRIVERVISWLTSAQWRRASEAHGYAARTFSWPSDGDLRTGGPRTVGKRPGFQIEDS